MPLISVFGPNAIGKTTAVKRWRKRYKSMCTFIDADLNLVMEGEAEWREKGWSGTIEEKRALVTKYRALPKVTVVVTARTATWIQPGDYVLILSCDWKTHEKHIRARCDAKGKRFRDDFWTEKVLRGESSRRYINFGAKYVDEGHLVHKVIEDQARDWPVVDEAFYRLFRKVHNEMIRCQ